MVVFTGQLCISPTKVFEQIENGNDAQKEVHETVKHLLKNKRRFIFVEPLLFIEKLVIVEFLGSRDKRRDKRLVSNDIECGGVILDSFFIRSFGLFFTADNSTPKHIRGSCFNVSVLRRF